SDRDWSSDVCSSDLVHPASGGGCGDAESMSQRGLESRANHLAHEKRGCVVAPARSSFVRVHHPFEHTAKHVRRDEFAVIVLADGEMESLEHLVERVAPLGVGPDGRAVPPFERRGLEESAIEEWDLA